MKDVSLKTNRKRWTIEKGGERGSGMIYIYIKLCVCVCVSHAFQKYVGMKDI